MGGGRLFRRSGPRSSYWEQTARLLHRAWLRATWHPTKGGLTGPALTELATEGPRNLETPLLIYRHTHTHVSSDIPPSRGRPFEL